MIEVRNLTKAYRPKKGNAVQALKGINLQFEETGLVFILGKSGSGKSTLLNMLGGLDQFDSGEIIIKGKSSKDFAQSDFDSYRNTFIGFIFQEYNILNDFTVGANIALAMELQGKKPTNEMLNKILEEVDLVGFANRKPNELSGGQKQRVAIARALIKNPEIIMADEPTGALDSNTGKQVFDTLKELAKEKLVIVVSHDREFAEQYGDRVIEMRDGEVVSDIKKYTESCSKVSGGIQIIEDKIIHIKQGYELTVDDMNMINEYLRKNKDHDSFISLDDRTNDKIKQIAQIDEDGNQEAFKDTCAEDLKIAEYDGSKLSFIKSKLPFKSSIKMAAGSLKKKPFRLIMTILLSMVAFTLFGLVNTMSEYNKIKAGTDSIIDSNVDYAAFTKQTEVVEEDFSYYTDTKMTDEDVENIQKQYPDRAFTKVVNSAFGGITYFEQLGNQEKVVVNNGDSSMPTSFSGVASLSEDVIKDMGYKLTGRLPKEDTEIVITKVVADTFIKAGYREAGSDKKEEAISTADQMIGKTLQLAFGAQSTYTITGILDTNFDSSRYESVINPKQGSDSNYSLMMLAMELDKVYNSSFHTVAYTTQAVFDKAISENKVFRLDNPRNSVELSYGESERGTGCYIEFGDLDESVKKTLVCFDNKKKSLQPNEIILPASILCEDPALDAIIYSEKSSEEKMGELLKEQDKIAATKSTLIVRAGGSEANTIDTKIVGFYMDVNTDREPMVILPDGFFKENNIDASGKYSALLGKMPSDRAGVAEVLRYSEDNGIDHVRYQLQNCTTDMLDTVDHFVEGGRTVFLWIAVVFAVFASVMLMNFIATSISYRKREIGILRAVGARGRDVFVIFFQESTIIALINWIIALATTKIVVFAINNAIRSEYNFVITVLHFGMYQVVVILALCLIVAFVASFIPVFNVSRKKPIEVIRKN